MTKPGFHEDDPVDKSYDRTLLRRLLRYLRPYWAPVLASFLLIVGMAALDLVGPYLTKIAIDQYIAHWNDHPTPFVWTKTADEILASVVRFCQRISETPH